EMRAWTEALVRRAHAPLLLGSVAIEHPNQPNEQWLNGAFVATPDGGLQKDYYAKRHLVPFGEFVPLRPILGWIGKFVPIGDDFQPGQDASPLSLTLRGQPLLV